MYAFALATRISVSDPRPMTKLPSYSNFTIASPIASIPSVTASILHSFKTTFKSTCLSIAL